MLGLLGQHQGALNYPESPSDQHLPLGPPARRQRLGSEGHEPWDCRLIPGYALSSQFTLQEICKHLGTSPPLVTHLVSSRSFREAKDLT